MWPSAKRGTPVSVITSVSSPIFLLPLFPIFLCPFLTPFPSSLASISHNSASLTLYILPYLLYLPSPSLLIPPPQIYSPSPSTRMVIIAEENSLDLKISASLSLCSCRGTSPKAAVYYGWPCLLTSSGGPSTCWHTSEKHTHPFQRMLKKQLSLLFSSIVIAVIPSQANLVLVPSCSEKPSSYKVPSSITELLVQNRSLWHYLLNPQ